MVSFHAACRFTEEKMNFYLFKGTWNIRKWKILKSIPHMFQIIFWSKSEHVPHFGLHLSINDNGVSPFFGSYGYRNISKWFRCEWTYTGFYRLYIVWKSKLVSRYAVHANFVDHCSYLCVIAEQGMTYLPVVAGETKSTMAWAVHLRTRTF